MSSEWGVSWHTGQAYCCTPLLQEAKLRVHCYRTCTGMCCCCLLSLLLVLVVFQLCNFDLTAGVSVTLHHVRPSSGQLDGADLQGREGQQQGHMQPRSSTQYRKSYAATHETDLAVHDVINCCKHAAA
jgi:hypothetical protein